MLCCNAPGLDPGLADLVAEVETLTGTWPNGYPPFSQWKWGEAPTGAPHPQLQCLGHAAPTGLRSMGPRFSQALGPQVHGWSYLHAQALPCRSCFSFMIYPRPPKKNVSVFGVGVLACTSCVTHTVTPTYMHALCIEARYIHAHICRPLYRDTMHALAGREAYR